MMVGEESTLMQARAVLEIKGFQHLSIECLQNNLTHPACFCSDVVTVLSSFNGIHFWTEKKDQKIGQKIASLSTMDTICPTPSLLFKNTLSVPEIDLETCSINSLNICDSLYMSRCIKLINKRVNDIM